MPLCTEDDPRVARCILLFLVLCQVIVYLYSSAQLILEAIKQNKRLSVASPCSKYMLKSLTWNCNPSTIRKAYPKSVA